MLFAQANPWIKQLPSGASVSLVAVTDPVRQLSWQPDGKRLPIWVFPETLKRIHGYGSTSPNAEQEAEFVLQIYPKHPDSMPDVFMRLGQETLGYAFVLKDDQCPELWWAGAGRLNRKLAGPVNLTVGIAEGSWKTAGSYDLKASKAKGLPFFRSLRHPPLRRLDQEDTVAVSAKRPIGTAVAYRFKVYDSAGASLMPAGNAGQLYFFRTSGKPAVRVELQSRPYQWAFFKSVWPRPKG